MSFKFKMETDTGSTTVTQGLPEMVVDKLNRLAIECGYRDISRHAIEYVGWGDNTSTTTIFNRNPDDAYTLNPVIAVSLRGYNSPGIHAVPETYTGAVGLHRAMLSYSAMSRINNVADMKQTMSHVINAGVIDLINQFGYRIVTPGWKITMERPGQAGIFFRDVEDTAAFEIRLLLTKE